MKTRAMATDNSVVTADDHYNNKDINNNRGRAIKHKLGKGQAVVLVIIITVIL